MPLNIDWQQILLHLLNVTILFAVLYFLLYKPVKRFMAGREAAYREKEKQTQKALEQAESARAQAEKKLADCDRENDEKRRAAEREAGELAAKIRADAERQAQEILATARACAEKEKERAVEEASAELSKLAQDAAKRAAAESTAEAYEQFLKRVEGGGDHA